MGFSGFADEAFEFYEGLSADNTKAYWTAHKETYEQHVRAPMIALFEELEPEFGPAKMFRPYRDVRFSKDKSPYKTQQGAHTSEGFYCAIDADGLMVAAGMYGPSPDQLRRFRTAVDADGPGKALEAIVEELRAGGYQIAGDRLKSRPRGVADDHPRLDLLRHRSLYAHVGWPPDPWMQTPELVTRVRDAWRGLRPLVDWENEHVGQPNS
ncbi:MAG TPA: DUF2461 domain-containing protein [Streptosporangiaceae bacterium]|jgi:uncharacterized protein (TIGR02453 family)